MGWGSKWDVGVGHMTAHVTIFTTTLSPLPASESGKKPLRGSVLPLHLDDTFSCTIEKGFVHFQRGSNARGKLVYGCFPCSLMAHDRKTAN